MEEKSKHDKQDKMIFAKKDLELLVEICQQEPVADAQGIDIVLNRIHSFFCEYSERIEEELGKADFHALYNEKLYSEDGFDNFWEELDNGKQS